MASPQQQGQLTRAQAKLHRALRDAAEAAAEIERITDAVRDTLTGSPNGHHGGTRRLARELGQPAVVAQPKRRGRPRKLTAA